MANSQNSGSTNIQIPIPYAKNPNGGGNAPSDLRCSVMCFENNGISLHIIRNHPVLQGTGYHEVMEALVNSRAIHVADTYFLYQTVDSLARGQLMTVSEENGSLVVKPGLPDAPSIPRLTCWPPRKR